MRRHRGIVFRIPILIGISAGAAVCTSGPAVAATRDLTGYGGPAVTFTVTINLEPPDGTILAAIEEAPPAGWDIENISDNGTWDTGTEQIKWGPF